MTHTDIRRMEISDVDLALAKERTELAAKADKLLGYRNLRTGNHLIDKLHELGINPLNKTDVRDYMRSKEKKFVRTSTKVYATWVALIVGLGYSAAHFHNEGCGIAAVFLGLVLLFLGLPALADGAATSPKRWREWRETSLGSYNSQVPEHIVYKAVQIKEVCPTASFVVHHLVDCVEERPARMTSDPFLEVRLGNESYFIDVWDEKDFVEA